MKKIYFILIIVSFIYAAKFENDSLKQYTDYSFIIQDSPSILFTMKQFNQCYLSSYRLFAKGLRSVVKNEEYADIIQLIIHGFFFYPLTPSLNQEFELV